MRMIEDAEAENFITTKQYRKFAEFCDTCRDERYIGLCYGAPGVGKTFSAQHYSCWPMIETFYDSMFKIAPLKAVGRKCRVIFLTAPVHGTAKIIEKQLNHRLDKLYNTVRHCVSEREGRRLDRREGELAELIIVDESDRLRLDALEQLRDSYDRTGIALVLIGMPGMEKRLSRYAQLYSRVGFVHEFKPLAVEELKFLLEQNWKELNLNFDVADFTDQEVLSAITRITNGNFRLVKRLLTQSQRIMRINKLKLITREVIDAAREALVIGTM